MLIELPCCTKSNKASQVVILHPSIMAKYDARRKPEDKALLHLVALAQTVLIPFHLFWLVAATTRLYLL